MWKKPGCTLTTKDYEILQHMLDEYYDQLEAMTWLLRQKLKTARVVRREDMPDNVVTLNSRISFRVGNGVPETRIISRDRSAGPVGYFLPITTMRGLSLLGLSEGQAAVVSRSPSVAEILQVTAVHYQPERAEKLRNVEAIRPVFRLIEGGRQGGPALAGTHTDGDDPGPSAA